MLRVDAFATLYFFHPLRRLSPTHDRLPILMYHSVSNREERTHPYYRTVTSPDMFAQQMRYLHENEYSTLGLGEAVKWLESPRTDGRRPVVITFDDGFQDFYTSAFPILSRHGFSATMFLPTAFIGNSSRTFKNLACLTWAQVRNLGNAGIAFGSHTVSHPQLRSLRTQDVQREIEDSKNAIEQELGSAVTSFAYPYAFPKTDVVFTAALRGLLENAGYKNGVCTVLGTAHRTGEPFFMRRLPINSRDDLRLFEAKLEGGYDWLRTLQYASKLSTGFRSMHKSVRVA